MTDVILSPTTTTVHVTAEDVPGALAALRDRVTPGEGGLVVAAGVGANGPDEVARATLEAAGLDPDGVIAAREPSGVAGATAEVPLAPNDLGVGLVVLVGTGEGTPEDLRTSGAAVARASRERVGLVSAVNTGDAVAAYVEGLVLGGYAPPRWTAGHVEDGATPVREAQLVGSLDAAAVRRATVRARATLVARNLGNVPANIKNPEWMASRAREVADSCDLEVAVWDEDDLGREGFGGLLAVGGGSATPPRLVRLGWTPEGAGEDTPHVVLVGKGITFDSGGLDVKPATTMVAMKTDMSGAAVVLAVLAACRDLEVPVRVTGLLALAENALGGSSYRPGDVVTQFGGRTVEIGNTDAEGRIVLADAMAYADSTLAPDLLVDIATLTGAARVALARSMAPVYGTDAALRAEITAAGEVAGEPWWPFPLVEDYRPALDSDVADVSHIGPAVRGGSITAALFLREFAGTRPWAHLDIAGAGRSDVDTGMLAKGATGYGARTLLSWLERAR